LYDELKIPKKQVFLIGDIDGVSLIMTLLFVLFVIPFLKSISLFSYVRRSVFGRKKNKKGKSGLCTIYKDQLETRASNNGECATGNTLLPSMSPISEDYHSTVKNRNNQTSVFDRMTYVGDLLEKFIEKKFTQ
jgi:hypothetical protein